MKYFSRFDTPLKEPHLVVLGHIFLSCEHCIDTYEGKHTTAIHPLINCWTDMEILHYLL